MRDKSYKIPKVIRFNWDILNKYTDSNPRKMLEFFYNVYISKAENYLYLNTWAAQIIIESRNEDFSYIVNISELYRNAKSYTNSEIYVYLDLASRRDYFTFLNTKCKVRFLPIWKIRDYDIEKLKLNRLLIVNDTNIQLIYEGE